MPVKNHNCDITEMEERVTSLNEMLWSLHEEGFDEMRGLADFKALVMEDGTWTITKPDEEEFSYRALNPFLYDDFQEFDLPLLMEIVGCPREDMKKWSDICGELIQDQRVLRAYKEFKYLPDSANEARVSTAFISLAAAIAEFLSADVDEDPARYSIIGGHLCNKDYNTISKTDRVYVSGPKEVPVMAVVVKTVLDFNKDSFWYHGNRSLQIFSALYSTNAPTFLISQKYWKIFFENADRNKVYSQVGVGGINHRRNCTLISNMSTDFVKAVGVCFMSNKVAKRQTSTSLLVASPVVHDEEIRDDFAYGSATSCKRRKHSTVKHVNPTVLDSQGSRRAIRVYSEEEIAELMFSLEETSPGTAE